MLNKLMKLKNKKGFTLVELIVVIAIIAILTAIIVPLVGRYSAQARYTTLNDAASTISGAVNNGLSDANQIGVINVAGVTGNKDASGVLEVTVGTVTVSGTAGGTLTTTPTTGADKAQVRAAERIHASLAAALPNNCAFGAAVASSACAGVIYTNAGTALPNSLAAFGTSAATSSSFQEVSGFDNAYETATGNSAVGLTGKFIPQSGGTTTTTAAAAG